MVSIKFIVGVNNDTSLAKIGPIFIAVIFGVQHLATALLIFASAAAGAMLRRCVAQYSGNVFLQPFCAALLAGVIGALAVRFQLSSSLRLVAVCPCMVLVPGPHVLNGALDIIRGRIHLGAARLMYAGLVIGRGESHPDAAAHADPRYADRPVGLSRFA
jgi:uncharacterized membrane protein YjjP (DUF1212 family)